MVTSLLLHFLDTAGFRRRHTLSRITTRPCGRSPGAQSGYIRYHVNIRMALVPFLAEAFEFPIFAIIAIGGSAFVGLVQGVILGRAISRRFARVRQHARIAAVGLLILFLANAVISLPRFSSPDKIRLSEILAVGEPQALADALFTLLGVGTGFLAVLAISVTVVSLVMLRMGTVRGASRAFVIIVSALVLALTAAARLTYLTPSSFEVLLYFMYQMGITAGIFWGTIRTRD